MVQKTMRFETIHVNSTRHVKRFLLSSLKKYSTSNVLPSENAPYPTSNRGTATPTSQHPQGIGKLKTYNDVVKL